MKTRFFCAVAVCFIFVAFVGCTSVENADIYNGKRIKTALYIGNGSSGGGVVHLARLLKYSPQVDLTLVDGEDLRKGKLKDFELVVMPGGSSARQMKSMGKKGVESLRSFIRNGGAYIGICAGCHITLNRKSRARIFPYTLNSEASGYSGDVYIDIEPETAKLLDISGGRYCVRYSQGPILTPAQWEDGKCETLASYKSSVGPIGKAGKSFYGTPAMIYGNFGKGKVIATSFHPEYRIDSYDIFKGCFYAVTGLKLTPNIPSREFHPLRVAYYYGYAQSKSHAAVIDDVISLEKCPELAVEPALIDAGVLDRTDLVILGDSKDSAWAKFNKTKMPAMLTGFMNKGGKVLAVGSAWNDFPEHKNLVRIKCRKDLVETVLDLAD